MKEGIACIKIARPKVHNAMDLSFLPEMLNLLDELAEDRKVRCIILTGEGNKSFSAGGDLKEELENIRSNHNKQLQYNILGDELIVKMLGLRLPIVTAVNGYAFGAAIGMIVASDISIASENALFSIPTCGLAGIPGWGCTQLVTRVIGMQNVKRMLLANERFDAKEALRIGLIGSFVKPEELMSEALKYAETIASYHPKVMETAKRIVLEGLERPLKDALTLEHEAIRQHNLSPAFDEGITAFMEKRKPDFEQFL